MTNSWDGAAKNISARDLSAAELKRPHTPSAYARRRRQSVSSRGVRNLPTTAVSNFDLLPTGLARSRVEKAQVNPVAFAKGMDAPEGDHSRRIPQCA